MIHFECDYAGGCHPFILDALAKTNDEQTDICGEDRFCISAAEKIRKYCGREDVDVHFLSGGTQTNLTVIASALKPYQGIIAPVTGHINIHETGAIEACGHKILSIDSHDGKLTGDQIEFLCKEHYDDVSSVHMVQPGMVYISNPTENGLIYTKKELSELREVCNKWNLFLFLDGARLGYGLVAQGNDLTLNDISNYCDVFYIGGTKVGALLGEAIVISNPQIKKDFRYNIKQRGGMLAKGRLLGIQFDVLFTDNLYFEISRHAISMAEKITAACKEKGCSFLCDSVTNQIFPIFSNEEIAKLQEKYEFYIWKKIDGDSSAIRLCTSWDTKSENISALISDIASI